MYLDKLSFFMQQFMPLSKYHQAYLDLKERLLEGLYDEAFPFRGDRRYQNFDQRRVDDSHSVNVPTSGAMQWDFFCWASFVCIALLC